MSQWTVKYLDQMARETLERSVIERRRSVFAPSEEPGFDFDKTTGMVVRAWMYARDHPSWMQEVPYDESTERFAELLGWAVEKTTQTHGMNAKIHVSNQIAERELVTDFVNWALQGVTA